MEIDTTSVEVTMIQHLSQLQAHIPFEPTVAETERRDTLALKEVRCFLVYCNAVYNSTRLETT